MLSLCKEKAKIMKLYKLIDTQSGRKIKTGYKYEIDEYIEKLVNKNVQSELNHWVKTNEGVNFINRITKEVLMSLKTIEV